MASESQRVGNSTNRDLLFALRQFVIERGDVEDVFKDLNVNVNALEVSTWQIVPVPDRFADALFGVALLNSVVAYLARLRLLPFAQFSILAYGKEV